MKEAGLSYPVDWKEISDRIKSKAGWRCERCGEPDSGRPDGALLTVHHLDRDETNNCDWNLAALCQRCHLSIQGRVDLYQAYMFEHSGWMRPHVEGFRKWAGLTGKW